MDANDLKRRAAAAALDLVEPDMILGLGTGSTAAAFVDQLGERVRDGLSVSGIATSEATRAQAASVGVDIIEPDETTEIDLAVDGADEIGPRLALIKGGGGALLREKIIADAAKKFVVIADASKRVATLGAFPLPVEIDQFSWGLTVKRLREALGDAGFDQPTLTLRAGANGAPFLSDGGNFIIDCKLGRIEDPAAPDLALRALPGVVETGLFIGIADTAFVADENGVERLSHS
ncbi:MAG: ribose-5-phosphate isomerase RpiA [Pseudomonadota bacterium]